ncbi:bifunctional [glutamine synthetase] adenylyltransferase/[glutamine synthetase]-adenylyl-L-tyrosine phosphorylase [Candidatus Puniceispirillum sp.]|nr:bifunctional [glutamine synthetase] adenylyltransferase/[glutamine synthetase]-adenylyl-L-tyrosine phosphorylase [Candidatus Puniceispirillum sp.]
MSNPIYYDQICPRMPLVDTASKALRDDFIKIFVERWPDSGLQNTKYATNDLAAMLLHSPYLQRLALRHGNVIAGCLNGHAREQITKERTTFIQMLDNSNDDNAAMHAIRVWRERCALLVALSDITGLCDMKTQMHWLSDAAQIVLIHTVGYLFRRASKHGNIKYFAKDFTGCGWTILALGKLGANELNFSSDIDLIVLHDKDHAPFKNPEVIQPFFVTMTRDLIKLLSKPTQDGIGWRVDLRLRPDPGATAVSIDVNAAIGYYESIARTWERAAFIRARPIAGDLKLGLSFLEQIKPFIWRKTLDYTVMEDMKMMLQRPPQSKGWLGYNLKTGVNSIRQIEFFIHVLQLVTGGRDTNLRHNNSLLALNALAAANWITHKQSNALGNAYHKLRRIEHRLQMIGDNQTHSLPRSETDLEKFAHFMGHDNAKVFCDELQKLMGQVGQHTTHNILDPPSHNNAVSDNSAKNVLLDDYESLIDWLADNGFQRPNIVADTLSGWMAGRILATRGERAQAILNRLMPDILMSFAEVSAPDDKFAALAQFIEGLPASVQILSLLDYNRHLTRLLCDILLLSPQLGNLLRQHPTLFDLLLYKTFFEPLPKTSALTKHLKECCAALPLEEALDQLKIQTREWKFRVEVQALSQTINSTNLAKSLSAIATATVVLILDLAKADMLRRHGAIEGKVNVLGLGSLGTEQMTVGSDLDLMIIYEAPKTVLSKGSRPINAPTYFARLAQTMVSWISTATAEGVLYPVDLRLRPEGKAGAIATSLERLDAYFANDAWVWEKMAMSKARSIAGDTCLTNNLETTLHQIVNQPHHHATVGKAVKTMLERVRKSRNTQSKWHLWAHNGGLVDLDFLIQAMRIQYGDLFAGTGQSPLDILETMVSASKISQSRFSELHDAVNLFEEVHQCIRLTFGNAAAAPSSLPVPLRKFMLTRMDLANEDQLTLLLKASLCQVQKHLENYTMINHKKSL